MSTTKPRINITVEPNIEVALKAIAKRDRVPVASKAAELLNFALEIEEDLVWGKVVLERMSHKDIRWIPHDTLWKKVRSR